MHTSLVTSDANKDFKEGAEVCPQQREGPTGERPLRERDPQEREPPERERDWPASGPCTPQPNRVRVKGAECLCLGWCV